MQDTGDLPNPSLSITPKLRRNKPTSGNAHIVFLGCARARDVVGTAAPSNSRVAVECERGAMAHARRRRIDACATT